MNCSKIFEDNFVFKNYDQDILIDFYKTLLLKEELSLIPLVEEYVQIEKQKKEDVLEMSKLRNDIKLIKDKNDVTKKDKTEQVNNVD